MVFTRTVPVAERPVNGAVRPPGSKSATIRAVTTASLASGRSHLYGPLEADDSRAVVDVMRAYGVDIDDSRDPWTIDGTGGRLLAPDHVISARESGLTARIVTVLAAFADGTTVIDGEGRLRERPIDALVSVLGDQGVVVGTTGGFLPVTITGQGGLWGGELAVDCTKSSQFATAVLLAAPLMTQPAVLRLIGLEGSAGYLTMTTEVMEAFGARVSPTFTGYEVSNDGYRPADYVVEPDASAAVYPMVAAAITGGIVTVEGLALGSSQPDVGIALKLRDMGCSVHAEDGGVIVDASGVVLQPLVADMSDAPDGSLALAVACLFASGESRLTGLGSLRYKESHRLDAMRSVLTELGASVTSDEDSLLIRPARLRAGVVDSHGDHRIAMSCALIGLKVGGVEVSDPGVVNKTWPGYWDMLSGLTSS